MPMPATVSPSQTARRRHWRRVGLLVLVFLVAYALGLAWLAERVEAGVEQSLHPAPAVLRARQAPEP